MKPMRAMMHELYPTEGWDQAVSVEMLSERLIQHYQIQAKVEVTTHVGRKKWAGEMELKAAAVYMREPVFVIDVQHDGVMYVQCYSYRQVLTKQRRPKQVELAI